MTAFVVQAPGEFGEFVGPRVFNDEADALAYQADINAALKPGVPQFQIGRVTW